MTDPNLPEERYEAAAVKNSTREVKQFRIHVAWPWGRMAFLCRDWKKYILVKMAWAYAKWFGPAQSGGQLCKLTVRLLVVIILLQSLDLVPTPELEEVLQQPLQNFPRETVLDNLVEAERNERVMGVSTALLQLLVVQNNLGELLNLNGDILNDILDCRVTRRRNDGKDTVAAMFAAIPQRSR
ncbi:hypothetical protein DFH07DRAFT_771856 [Mycena maculata]|uniref:Uncharacterized protein n=2 Tax=Mycena maculata TaxID=230809 RepID=A0AAD7NFN0_9AGAR|nr:hypothetical protein DFH07DRAFT_771856 [Mycena maculata]